MYDGLGKEKNTAPRRINLNISSRNYFNPKFFWPVLGFLTIVVLLSVFVYYDRVLAHSDPAELLPADTSVFMIVSGGRNHSTMQLQQLLDRVPGVSSSASLNEQSILSFLGLPPLPGNLNDVFANSDEQAYVAKVGDQYLLIAKPQPGANLKISEPTQVNGQKFYKLADWWLWPTRNFIYISSDQGLLQNLFKQKQASVLTSALHWRKDARKQTLAELPEYKQTFTTLPHNTWLKVFWQNQSLTSANWLSDLNIPATPQLLDKTVSVVASVLGADIFRKDPQVKSFSIQPQTDGVVLEFRNFNKQPGSAEEANLALNLPSEINGRPVALYAEISNLAQRSSQAFSDSDQLQTFLDNLKKQSNLDISETDLNTLQGQAAVMASMDDQGQPVLVFVAERTDKIHSEQLARSVSKNLAFLSKAPFSTVTGRYVVVGTNSEVAASVISDLDHSSKSLAKMVPQFAGKQSGNKFYLQTAGLITWVQGQLSKAGVAQSEVWPAVQALSEAIPTVIYSSQDSGQITQAHLLVSLKEISAYNKDQAEKIFSHLSPGADSSSASVRDSIRLADLTTLQNALKNYFAQNGRYPGVLNQLQPTFLNSLPADPRSQTTYDYVNSKGDKTFYLSLTMETQSRLGLPGVYCLNSKEVILSSNGTCSEK